MVANNHKNAELLAPAVDIVSLKAAIDAGADAVYFGLKMLNMRAMAKNFELSQLPNIVKMCHDNGVKAYLTLNIVMYDDELDKVDRAVKKAKEAGVDAIICWDFAVINACRKHGIEFHISTQASVSNTEAARFYRGLGAKRVVLARECSLEKIRKIHENIPELEIEAFVHGAMCMAVSGRCFLSKEMFGKSANRGECIQPCRREYKVIDKISGKELEVENHHIFSAKDLVAVEFIDKLLDAGITSFKIEGRAKQPEYVYEVVRVYRQAIDLSLNEKYDDESRKRLKEEVEKVYNRGISSGFYFGMPMNEWDNSTFGKAKKTKIYVGKISKVYKRVKVSEIKVIAHKLSLGDTIMIQGKESGVKYHTIEYMQDIYDNPVNEVDKGNIALIKMDFLPKENEKVFIWK